MALSDVGGCGWPRKLSYLGIPKASHSEYSNFWSALTRNNFLSAVAQLHWKLKSRRKFLRSRAAVPPSSTSTISLNKSTMPQQIAPRIGMRPQPFLGAAAARERMYVKAKNLDDCPDIRALNALALRSLLFLFDEKEKLFVQCLSKTEKGFQREEASRKHTMIALLGLHRLAASAEELPIDMSAIRETVLANIDWVKSLEDLGLLIWFTAECCPERLGRLFNNSYLEQALSHYSDSRQASTGGLSWLLAGIAHAHLACSRSIPDLTDVAVDTYHLLEGNQSESGIFGHSASAGFLRRNFLNRTGTFADQMYAIYAFTIFARAFQIEEPLDSALRCANSIRALQGELGQWWFLYDIRSSQVVNRYPLFSLHQDGIAPLALLALEEATGQIFHESVYKGMSWVDRPNELSDDLLNLDHRLIWDSIWPTRRISSYWERSLGFLNISHKPQIQSLRIQYAARADQLGWMLYAFGREGLPKKAYAAEAAASK
jgi:hypothetical protein